jgi:hypothetical protein
MIKYMDPSKISNHLQVLPNDVVGIIQKLVTPKLAYNLVYEMSEYREYKYEHLGTFLTFELAVHKLLECLYTRVMSRYYGSSIKINTMVIFGHMRRILNMIRFTILIH